MTVYILTPKVNEVQEFIEIANDFSNPLDLVREAISNAFDAYSTKTEILFDTETNNGEKTLVITLRDNGQGMDKQRLQSFFDLGNSLNRNDPRAIGEKGHGTKVYFNSHRIEVTTTCDGITLYAVMENPARKLYSKVIPEVIVEEIGVDRQPGTEIVIKGYHNNRRELFTHHILKDYILWFTKFGSIETLFGNTLSSYNRLILKGLDRAEAETINFGHIFPEESSSVEKLFQEYLVDAPDYYCKRIIKKGHLKNHPEEEYQAVFSIEGTKIKYGYNPMIKRSGYSAPRGAYTVQERYGLWLCKDYIPIQRKNEWISTKGYEYTRLHAFFNCQALNLTANRGSVDNTPAEVLSDIKNEITEIYESIIESEDWRNIDWLEEEAESYSTRAKEKKDFEWRIKRSEKANITSLNGHTLIEPTRESGVFALLIQLDLLSPGIFPFEVIDYDTQSGLDVIVKGNDRTPLYQSRLYYVELKYFLSSKFNHTFENLHSIVCWDTKIKHGEVVEDLGGQQRIMRIISPEKDDEYTQYFLDHPKSPLKIEVYVLKDYIKEKLGLEFRPRGVSV